MNSIHVEAYTETIIDQLQTKDVKSTALAVLKRVGLMAGGAVLGTFAIGPLGFVIGGGVGSAAAAEVGGPDKDIKDMCLYLRGLEFSDKATLVHQLEEIVGDTNTEDLVKFCKNKQGRDMFVNTVCQFLLDKTPMHVSEEYASRHVSVPLVKPNHYTQLLDFGEND